MRLQSIRSLLLLAAIALVLVAGCGSSVEAEQETLVLAGAGLIFEMQIAKILGNEQLREVYEVLAQNVDDVPNFDDALGTIGDEVGLDLDKVSCVLVFVDSSQLTATNDSPPGIIARGTFDEDQVVAALAEGAGDSLTSEEYKGHRVHTDSEGDIAISLLTPEILVLGPLGHVQSVIDLREGDTSPAAGAAHVAFGELKESWVRLAFVVPPQVFEDLEGGLDAFPIPIDGDLFKGIQIVTITVQEVSDGISVRANVDFASESMASDATDAVDGLLKVIGAFSSDEEVDRALEKVQVSVDGTRLSVSYEASFDDLKEAAAGLSDGLPELSFLTQ